MKEGQYTEEEILDNNEHSPLFDEFLQIIGDKVRLKGDLLSGEQRHSWWFRSTRSTRLTRLTRFTRSRDAITSPSILLSGCICSHSSHFASFDFKEIVIQLIAPVEWTHHSIELVCVSRYDWFFLSPFPSPFPARAPVGLKIFNIILAWKFDFLFIRINRRRLSAVETERVCPFADIDSNNDCCRIR